MRHAFCLLSIKLRHKKTPGGTHACSVAEVVPRFETFTALVCCSVSNPETPSNICLLITIPKRKHKENLGPNWTLIGRSASRCDTRDLRLSMDGYHPNGSSHAATTNFPPPYCVRERTVAALTSHQVQLLVQARGRVDMVAACTCVGWMQFGGNR